MKNIISICFCFGLILFVKAYAQNVTVLPNGITPAAPNSYQRLTYDELMALPSPQEGDIAYDLTFKCMRVFADGKWVSTIVDPLNYSPNFIPVLTAGGSSGDYAGTFAIDDSSNFYITGSFIGIAFFGTTQVTSNSNNGNMYVAKYNKDRVLQWVRTGGSAPYGASGVDVEVDSKGNVFIRGTYGGNATFDTITVSSNVDGNASYLAKYNSSGAIQWVKATNKINISDIIIDENDNFYTTGWYSGTQTFGSTTLTASPNSTNTASSTDFYLAKYDIEADDWVWAKSFGSTGSETGGRLGIDGSGNLYVTGTFSGTVAFGSVSKTASAASNSFIGKYNQVTEDWAWVQAYYPATGYALYVDNGGNLYLTASFTGSITFGTTTKNATSGGSSDIFMVKMNTDGVVQVFQTFGSTSNDGGSSIVTDAEGNIYLAGYFAGTVKFGSKTLTATASKALFIARFNSIGGTIWVQKIDRQSGSIGSISRIITAPDGQLYSFGSFTGTISIGKTVLTSKGETDVFVFKVD